MAEESRTLFDKIGGEAGIERLVGEFYERVLADEVLAPFFEGVPIERLQAMQKEFFSEALGGPLFYSGRSLRQVHDGRGITKEHLRRFVGHLMATLEESQDGLGLSRQDVDAIHSRIAVEADRITNDATESG